MDKLGKAEITNNIYSLAVQAYDGGAMTLPTRLTFTPSLSTRPQRVKNSVRSRLTILEAMRTTRSS